MEILVFIMWCKHWKQKYKKYKFLHLFVSVFLTCYHLIMIACVVGLHTANFSISHICRLFLWISQFVKICIYNNFNVFIRRQWFFRYTFKIVCFTNCTWQRNVHLWWLMFHKNQRFSLQYSCAFSPVALKGTWPDSSLSSSPHWGITRKHRLALLFQNGNEREDI